MAKINTLVLLGGAAAAYFLLTGNKKETLATSTPVKTSDGVVKYPGYEITNCKTIEITDLAKAKKYAFDVGFSVSKDSSPASQALLYSKKLFGSVECLDSIIDEDVYILLRQAFIGAVKKFNYESDVFAMAELINDNIKKLGFEPLEDPIYDFLLEMKNTIGGAEYPGYIIGNCNYLYIYDEEKAYDYIYNVGKKGLDHPTWLKEVLGGCSPEDLTQGIDDFWALYVYNAAGTLNGNKDNVDEMVAVLQQAADTWAEADVKVEVPTKEKLIGIIDFYEG